jgi:hypothetical protein
MNQMSDSGNDIPLPTAEAPVERRLSSGRDGAAAVIKFKSCRWRASARRRARSAAAIATCLPMAGATGFDADAWCPDCSFYKLRRTPKKRSPEDYRY